MKYSEIKEGQCFLRNGSIHMKGEGVQAVDISRKSPNSLPGTKVRWGMCGRMSDEWEIVEPSDISDEIKAEWKGIFSF
tara:strand:+ start:417 stop:650 length:234 start_codon:yes stop_codon:yes gene_type:complete